MTYMTLHPVFLGTILLLGYIIIDFFRKKLENILRRLVFYSFIFYLVIVAQLITGGITIPPEENPLLRIQLIPFFFVYDLYVVREMGDWFFWNAVKLSFYNLIMLFPLGFYLGLIFGFKPLKNGFFIMFLFSLGIELLQLLLGFFGLVSMRGFNIDDIILNSLGGLIGLLSFELVKKYLPVKVRSISK